MTTSTFGEHLKREREMRGVSLDEISAATRIGTRFLNALENEQWDRLPGGVFNRGFVRAISRFLGLDEENLLAEYALAVHEQGETPAWTGAGFPPSARTNWLTWLLAGVIAIMVIGGAWAAWRRHVAKKAQSQGAALILPASNTPPLPPIESPERSSRVTRPCPDLKNIFGGPDSFGTA
jgi:cytoskeletal protein RodZ